MTSSYSIIDTDFLARSVKISDLGEGTFGAVALYNTPSGRHVIKETKLDHKSLGYPPDFLTEIDMLMKFRPLESIVRMNAIYFDTDAKKGYALLEVLTCNLSEWIRKTEFKGRIKQLVNIIQSIGGCLAMIHLFQFLHNDIKTNNILVDESSPIPKFKLADLGKAIRVRDEDKTPYGGIEKYRPPYHRNIYESEYWAFMVVLTEVILGSRMVNSDNVTGFYWKYTENSRFQLSRYLSERLSTSEYNSIPIEYWHFVNPILHEKRPRIIDSLRLIGTTLSENMITTIRNNISTCDEKPDQYFLIKEECKMILSRMGHYDYYARFSRLMNKFLSEVNEPLDIQTLRCYAEVALVIVLKSKIKQYTYLKNEKEFLFFQRAFVAKIGYQTVVN